MSFFSELLGFKGAGRQLNHVEPVVKHLPITPEDLEAMNPALAAFYKEHLATQPTEIGVRIRNSFEPVGDHSKELAFYRWTLHVDFDNQLQEQHISAVIFDLHPTFNPPSVRIEKPGPWSFTRVGWGEFKIGITLVDRFSNTHTFAHDLTLSNPNNEHAHSFFITPPASSTSSSGAATSSTSSSSSSTSSSAKVPKMKGVPESEMHGFLGVDKGWAAPNLVTFCDEEARPGYASRKAHEYNEDPDVLRAKVRLLADLLRRSKHCVCYTGAGISTSAGIDDYASKSKESIATGSRAARPRAKRGLAAEPSFAHHTLTALHRAGHLQHWVQQNHDGLPQKAGFPQEAINEIHGAWFDPSNPVVPMSGSLRGDLMAWLLREEQAADLVLAMGTSLCGMNADRMVKTPGKKALRGKGLGSVIVGIQQTQLDNLASLRIFARIDEVMLLLAIEMQLDVRTRIYTPTVAKERISKRPYVYLVPYHPSTGLPSKKLHPWDLSPGAALQLTGGPGAGFCGSVRSVPKTAEDHFTLCFPNTREGPELGKGFQLYALGSWWIEACTQGRVPQLPVINVLADSDQID